MVRVKRGNVAAKRRKSYIKLAKGYVGSNSKLSTFAGEQIVQSFNFAYIGRKLKKRNFRRIWIYRINVAAKINNINYSSYIGKLRKNNVLLNRKMLAELAFNNISIFNLIYKKIVKI
jgi:large subunit ribosomal protein L20